MPFLTQFQKKTEGNMLSHKFYFYFLITFYFVLISTAKSADTDDEFAEFAEFDEEGIVI